MDPLTAPLLDERVSFSALLTDGPGMEMQTRWAWPEMPPPRLYTYSIDPSYVSTFSQPHAVLEDSTVPIVRHLYVPRHYEVHYRYAGIELTER